MLHDDLEAQNKYLIELTAQTLFPTLREANGQNVEVELIIEAKIGAAKYRRVLRSPVVEGDTRIPKTVRDYL